MKLLMATILVVLLAGCATPMTPEQEAAYVEKRWGTLCNGDRACMMNYYNHELDREAQRRAIMGKSIQDGFQSAGDRMRGGRDNSITCTTVGTGVVTTCY